MAKKYTSMHFKNACIDFKNMTITETTKDNIEEYDLNKVLQEWAGIDGISFSLRKDSELEPICNDENEGGRI